MNDLVTTKLKDFKGNYGQNPSYLGMLESLEDIYYEFRLCPKPNYLTCVDWHNYNYEKAAEILSYNIRSIPDKLLWELEFYGDGEYWGTTLEVKYFLPRVLEYIANQFLLKEFYSDSCFFKCKLSQISNWTSKERDVILNFVYDMFEFLVNNFEEILEFVKLCQYLPLDGEKFIKIWSDAPHKMKNAQFPKVLDYSTSIINGKKELYIGNIDIIKWITKDEHILEYDFFYEDKYFYMICR
jgi:hypothetical protein